MKIILLIVFATIVGIAAGILAWYFLGPVRARTADGQGFLIAVPALTVGIFWLMSEVVRRRPGSSQ